MPPKKKDPVWLTSAAKQLLAQDMMDGIVPVDAPIKSYKKLYDDLYAETPEFEAFPFDHLFASRVTRLQATVKLLGVSAKKDSDGLAHDLALHPGIETQTRGPTGRLLWKDHEADRWLKVDMAAGKHLLMTPQELREQRDCYKLFSKQRFAKRIDQLKEAAKPFGATPGQARSKKLVNGCKEKSRKGLLDAYVNEEEED